MSPSAAAHPQNPRPCTPLPELWPGGPCAQRPRSVAPGVTQRRRALGLHFAKCPEELAEPAERRWAGLRLAGRPARGPAEPPASWRWRASEVGEPSRGRGEARREGQSGPAAGVPYPGHGGGARSGPRGHGQPGDPWVRTQVPSNRSRCPCRMHRRRGARRVHTHLPLRGPRSARRAGGHRRALCSAERSPIPDRRPARGRADGPRARRAPSRPAAAAPRSAPAGRGGERRRAASTRFPGRRASRPNPLQTSPPQWQWLGAQRALRPASGSPWVSPQASVTNFATPSFSTPPPPPAIFSTALPRCSFHGTHFRMGVPDGKGIDATKPFAMPPCQSTPQLAGLCCSDANPDLA